LTPPNYAYVADRGSGLRIIDISNPSAPANAGAIDTPGSATNVFLAGSIALVADGVTGIQAIDVSNPAAPVILSTIDTPGSASGLAMAGAFFYVADGASGLQILPGQCPASESVTPGGAAAAPPMALLAAWPNPAPGETAIDFELARATGVELAIYDATGREVRRLLDQQAPAGHHAAVWDGRNAAGRALASGVYYVRLRAGGGTATGRVTLVR